MVLKKKLHKKINKCSKKELKNINFWFKTIKNDAWYDYHFLYVILDKKLKHMIKNWNKSIHKGWKKERKMMRKTRKVLKKLIDDNYINDDIFPTKLYNEDKKKLFKLLEKNIDKWWD